MDYIAHIRVEADGAQSIQLAAEHCRNTAVLAGGYLEGIGLCCPAYLAGLLHDMGKFKQEFQSYILDGTGHRGSVVHTFAGTRYLLETYRKADSCDEHDITAEIAAYAVGAHHGVFDIESGTNTNGFRHRKENESIRYEESRDAFLEKCVCKEEIDGLMKEASEQVLEVVDKIIDLSLKGNAGNADADSDIRFYMGLLERTILSAVIDGDRTDTAAFESGAVCESSCPQADWSAILRRVEDKLDSLPAVKPIEIARRAISEQCRACADSPGGVLRLNVPTGAGKTLSSLRYALAHAAKWCKSRIIFAAPLLTIIEQNAAELRKYIQDDGIVLEHHSNVVNADASPEQMSAYEAASEKWTAPIIITTMVQLLNTMFSGSTSSVRRFHSLANSVIVVDEVQAVPVKLLSLFNMAINYLSEICKATVVLCSATQPCLENVEHPLVAATREIVPYDPALWSVFKRTELVDGGNLRLDEVPGFATAVLKSAESLLIVCNKKSEAAWIFDAMRDKGSCFHLSASMCTEHRREVLASIRDSLASGTSKTICVSTQVIEAGVDISFGAVIRLCAGMDSVIQAAGRCNRNAESEVPAPVYILKIVDEDLRRLGEIKRGKDSTINLLTGYKADPASYGSDLTSDVSIACYYKSLYGSLDKGATEHPAGGDTIYNLLSMNSKNCKHDSPYYYQQAFKTAGAAFSVFDDSSFDVVVPYREGANIVAKIEERWDARDFDGVRELAEKARDYTVSIYGYQRDELERQGGLQWLFDSSIATLDSKFYDEKTGLRVSLPTGGDVS